MNDRMTIDQLLCACLPDGIHEAQPIQGSVDWLQPLQDFVASGGNYGDYQEDLVLSVNGLSR
ncbi:MAG TPA: hypothetical protein VG929_05625 [Actinomycetota bacterium]|nr:hypothetical protein [Actinomycetota bacterium]